MVTSRLSDGVQYKDGLNIVVSDFPKFSEPLAVFFAIGSPSPNKAAAVPPACATRFSISDPGRIFLCQPPSLLW